MTYLCRYPETHAENEKKGIGYMPHTYIFEAPKPTTMMEWLWSSKCMLILWLIATTLYVHCK
jgi:hypothetical protein